MKTFEIYLQDLTPEAQERLSQYIDLKDSNYDVFPIATVDFEGDI